MKMESPFAEFHSPTTTMTNCFVDNQEDKLSSEDPLLAPIEEHEIEELFNDDQPSNDDCCWSSSLMIKSSAMVYEPTPLQRIVGPAFGDVAKKSAEHFLSSSAESATLPLFAPSPFTSGYNSYSCSTVHDNDFPTTALSLLSTAEALLADDIFCDDKNTSTDFEFSFAEAEYPLPLAKVVPDECPTVSSSASGFEAIDEEEQRQLHKRPSSIETTTSPSKRIKIEEDDDEQLLLPLTLSSAVLVSESSSSFPTATPKRAQSLSSGEEDLKFRFYQTEKWLVKFDELKAFKEVKGHCQVPHSYKENPGLGRWAKRQRYQYKLYHTAGKRSLSTMSQERIDMLEDLGFVWDSHSALWEERYKELLEFHMAFGHTNVPSNFAPNPKLAVWVKCQRRQYKLWKAGESSNMSPQRVERLNKVEFVWEVRRVGI